VAARCVSSTTSCRRLLYITLGLVPYSCLRSTTAFQPQSNQDNNAIPVGVQAREMAHILLQYQITLWWKY